MKPVQRRKAPASQPGAFTETPFRVFRDKLTNGLRVCTVETPHLHSAVVGLYVGVGSRFETRKNNGLSHFVEHMLFRGSEANPSSHALNRAIEERGGTLYAETGRDYSLYQISVHPREIEAALAILGDLFSAPLFSDIDRERRIVLEELLDDFDDRGRNVNVHDVSRELAWGEQPLGYPIIGPARNVRGFGVADVRRHFRQYYGASNLVLCVSGRVTRGQALRGATAAFARLPRGKRAVAKVARVSVDGPRMKFVHDEASQVQMQLLFHGLAEWDPDFFAMSLMMRLIDDGMSTPLHYRVADQKGLAYHVGAGIEALHDSTMIEIDATCSPRNLPAVLKESLQILGEVRDGGVRPEDLEKAKRRALSDLEAGFDDIDGLSGWFGGTELFFRPYSHAERAARIGRVCPEDVIRTARRVFRSDRMTLVCIGATSTALNRKVRELAQGFGAKEA